MLDLYPRSMATAILRLVLAVSKVVFGDGLALVGNGRMIRRLKHMLEYLFALGTSVNFSCSPN